MRKNATWLVCGLALMGLVLVSATRTAEARPNYLKDFKTTYPKLEAEADKVKCNVCHYGDKKTNRNDYGTAIGTALDGKNIKETDKVVEALKKAAKEKSATEGKTFGDLIEEGKLPGKNP